MKRSVNKKTLKVMAFLAMIILMATSFDGFAQTQERSQSKSVSVNTTEDGKVRLKVVTKVGDDTKTFEKTYDSYDEINGDPDLEKNGIDLSDWNFGGGSSAFGSSGAFQMGQGPSSMFDLDMDNMRKYMESMMRGGFGTNNFFFNFDNDDPFFMDMDSLQNQLNFHFKNGKMFQNGDEIMDMDSLREVLKNRFGNMDFDSGSEDGNFKSWSFGDDKDDDGFHVISRARVFIRAAKDKDKEIVGADKMEPLEIKDISFYPNPSDGRFDLQIETTDSGPIQVKIVSPIGNVVYDKTDSTGASIYNFKIDISDEREGVYILQVIQNNKTLTKRVIIE
ncbi:T9SS type A sorting domain-containing protein [Roseivirga sp.]|uniref:T9SS type A sorting domain-containing protein n=1 Tax=Roseivirga sp. TaxID=1964215 RepID=UPI002B26A8AC|nr:T9SS type A sorting domain-containing protein [Roseivirga sp.]